MILTSFYKETKLRRRKKRRNCVSPSFLMRIQLPRKPPSISNVTGYVPCRVLSQSSKPVAFSIPHNLPVPRFQKFERH